VQRQRAALGEREGPQVVDEPCEHLGLLEDRRKVRAIGRVHAVNERLDVALHHGQGRAELVRHIGEQLLPLRLARL